MSTSFRPVQEVWGECSGTFIPSSDMLCLLRAIATRVATSFEESDYGDKTSAWFEDGRKVLDYIEDNPAFTPNTLCEDLTEMGLDVTEEDLKPVIENMRSMAAKWRSSIGRSGELVMYVDAF